MRGKPLRPETQRLLVGPDSLPQLPHSNQCESKSAMIIGLIGLFGNGASE